MIYLIIGSLTISFNFIYILDISTDYVFGHSGPEAITDVISYITILPLFFGWIIMKIGFKKISEEMDFTNEKLNKLLRLAIILSVLIFFIDQFPISSDSNFIGSSLFTISEDLIAQVSVFGIFLKVLKVGFLIFLLYTEYMLLFQVLLSLKVDKNKSNVITKLILLGKLAPYFGMFFFDQASKYSPLSPVILVFNLITTFGYIFIASRYYFNKNDKLETYEK